MQTSTDTKHHVLVHKQDDEGALTIDLLTGGIVTEIDQRPDWAEGLTNALPREREVYYQHHLGDDYTATESFKHPTALAFEDLGWLGVDAEGDLVEIDADPEFRMAVVKEFLVIDEETGKMTKDGWRTVAEAEIAWDVERTTEEASAIDAELETNFGGTPPVHHNVKTGS